MSKKLLKETFIKYKFYIFFVIIVLFVLTNNKTFAWSYAGHELISQIAYEDLTKDQQTKLDKILDSLVNNLDSEDKKILKKQPYSLSNLAKLSILPDYWRSYNFDTIVKKLNIKDNLISNNIGSLNTANWHYKDTLVLDDNNYSNKPDKPDKAGKLDEVSKQLIKNTKATRLPQAKALGIIYLAHLLEDAHQPMHAMSKNNDLGGNKFCLTKNINCGSNLHGYWDHAGGLLTNNKKLFNFSNNQNNQSIIREIVDNYPKDYFINKINILDPDLWLQESYDYWPVVYNTQQNTPPSKIYQAKVQTVCSERIAIAGYRLSALIQKLI